MNLDEYETYDAIGLADLVRKKEVTPHELLSLALKKSKKVNPHINAIIYDMQEQALEQIKTLKTKNNGPFKGVPFLIKDLLQDYAHIPQSNGSKALKNYTPKNHSDLVNHFLKAGLIIFGKTNTPELGLMGVTEPKEFGITKNPHNLSYTAGGSSGGSAAAVASGIVPMAAGGDGGGSIRIPASCCGLVGLKATRGKFPSYPHQRVWDGSVVEGVLSKSVRDSAMALELFQGSDICSVIPPQKINFITESLKKSHSKKFKILYTTTSPLTQLNVDEDPSDAVKECVSSLKKDGHQLRYIQNLNIDGIEAAKSYLTMYMGQVAFLVEKYKKIDAKVKTKNFEITTQLLRQLGQSLSAQTYIESKQVWSKLTKQFNTYFQEFDLILTPTMATAPLIHGAFAPSPIENIIMKILVKMNLGKILHNTDMIEKMAIDSLTKLPFTFLTNLSGHPSINVPWMKNEKGLPIGVHFIGPTNSEISLLQMAKQIEDNR